MPLGLPVKAGVNNDCRALVEAPSRRYEALMPQAITQERHAPQGQLRASSEKLRDILPEKASSWHNLSVSWLLIACHV